MGRGWGALVLLTAVLAGCSEGSGVEISTTRRATPNTTDEPTPTTDEPTPTTDEPTPTTEDTVLTTIVPTSVDTTVVDTTVPDPDDEDPASTTTVVDPVDSAGIYALGSAVLVGDVGVTVTEYVPDAAALYDDPYLTAPDGWQLVAVRAVLTNFSPSPLAYFYPSPTVVLPDGTGFPLHYCGSEPWAVDMTNVGLMPGGTVDTVSCFLVPTDAVTQVALWMSTFDSSPVVLAVAPDQGSKAAAPLPARPGVPAAGSGPSGTWKSPVALGTATTAADYAVTVTAFNGAAPTPEFTPVPPEGWRYVTVDLSVTFNGSDPTEAGFVDLAVVGDSGRLYREDLTCRFDDEGDSFEPEPGVAQTWSRCFAVQDADIPTLELSFRPDFDEDMVFLAVR